MAAKQRLQLQDLRCWPASEPFNAAYLLEEDLRVVFRRQNPKKARAELRDWNRRVRERAIPELLKYVEMRDRRRFDILNVFKHRKTDGLSEGINNVVETIKRDADGFHDREYFRLKILRKCGKLEGAFMKALILAGGLGTRISEESNTRPKPMIEIGGKPILWHIMKIYSAHGVHDFVICCGYKGYVIKEYFANYFLHMSDVTFDIKHNRTEVHQNHAEPWRVTLVDTGEHTMTGGRLKRVRDHVEDDDFCLTYGDGVGDVDISSLIAFHEREGCLATLTATQPPGRFGAINVEGHRIASCQEKPKGDGSWINGGFFVLSPKVIDYIDDDHTVWEREPMERLARDGQLNAWFHRGFWQAMDTLRDKNHLEELWASGRAPWKVW